SSKKAGFDQEVGLASLGVTRAAAKSWVAGRGIGRRAPGPVTWVRPHVPYGQEWKIDGSICPDKGVGFRAGGSPPAGTVLLASESGADDLPRTLPTRQRTYSAFSAPCESISELPTRQRTRARTGRSCPHISELPTRQRTGPSAKPSPVYFSELPTRQRTCMRISPQRRAISELPTRQRTLSTSARSASVFSELPTRQRTRRGRRSGRARLSELPTRQRTRW